MKKVFYAILAVLFMFSMGTLMACGDNKPAAPTLKPAASDFSYYPKLPAAKEKKLFVIDGRNLTQDEFVTASCLQGLVSRTSSEIYIVTDADQGDASNYKLWLDDLTANYGYSVEPIAGVAALIEKYKSHITDNGIVVYSAANDASEDSLNVATTVCSAEGYIPVEEKLLAVAQSTWGLGEVKIDLTGYDENGDIMDERWSFAKYKNKLTKKILIHQDPQKHTLRDYAVAVNAFVFFDDSAEDKRFVTEVYQWADKDIPIIGWCEDELGYVALNSNFSKITIGADWSTNLTTLSSVQMPKAIEQTKYTQSTITPQNGKHYLAMVMSDGDNIQWMQSNFMNREEWYGSPFRGDFKITWGANPSASDLIPSVLQKVYNEATPKDEFITGVSGNGYINPTTYADLDTYVSRTDPYMKRAALKYVDLLDGGVDKNAIQPYGQMPNIGGGVWKVGNKYVEGAGSVYWANDKPFITFRESMWNENSRSMLDLANRVNHYQKDFSKIEGYTVLNIHPWSHTMTDVKRFVELLDEHVEIVTAGELIEMVKTNVAHKDVPVLENAEIPPVVVPNYVFPGVTAADLALLSSITQKTFTATDLNTKFTRVGKNSAHNEGYCLEVQTPAKELQSFLYAKFTIGDDNDILKISSRRFVRPGEVDAMLGVYVAENTTAVAIRAKNNNSDWLKIDSDSYIVGEYDLSAYKGKTISLAFGSKQGEHMAINSVEFVSSAENFVLPGVTLDQVNAVAVSQKYAFTAPEANAAWQKKATAGAVVELHNEGLCLQFAGQNTAIDHEMTVFIYNRFAITEAFNKLTVSARTFAGQNGPTANQDPQYIPQLQVVVIDSDGNKTAFPLKAVDKDTYTVADYYLTDYIGKTVTVAIGVGRGYHCAINSIALAEGIDPNKIVLPTVTLETVNAVVPSTIYSFTHNAASPADFYDKWQRVIVPNSGACTINSSHNEGLCLEFMGENAVDKEMIAFIYNRFAIDATHNKLTVSARTFAGQNAGFDPYLQLVIVKEDGTVIKKAAKIIDTDAYIECVYDLSDLEGQTVAVAIGAGRGYHCAIKSVTLEELSAVNVLPNLKLETINEKELSSLYAFEHNGTTQNIGSNWSAVSCGGQAGTTEHGEGFCLEFAGQNDAIDHEMTTYIYNRFAIDAAHNKLTISARTFAGQNAPAVGETQFIPQLTVSVVTADGTVYTYELVAIDTDEYIISDFDLSAYEGTDVCIAIGVGRGYHCAINSIVLGANA